MALGVYVYLALQLLYSETQLRQRSPTQRLELESRTAKYHVRSRPVVKQSWRAYIVGRRDFLDERVPDERKFLSRCKP